MTAKKKEFIFLAVVAIVFAALVIWIVWGNTAFQLNIRIESSNGSIGWIRAILKLPVVPVWVFPSSNTQPLTIKRKLPWKAHPVTGQGLPYSFKKVCDCHFGHRPYRNDIFGFYIDFT